MRIRRVIERRSATLSWVVNGTNQFPLPSNVVSHYYILQTSWLVGRSPFPDVMHDLWCFTSNLTVGNELWFTISLPIVFLPDLLQNQSLCKVTSTCGVVNQPEARSLRGFLITESWFVEVCLRGNLAVKRGILLVKGGFCPTCFLSSRSPITEGLRTLQWISAHAAPFLIPFCSRYPSLLDHDGQQHWPLTTELLWDNGGWSKNDLRRRAWYGRHRSVRFVSITLASECWRLGSLHWESSESWWSWSIPYRDLWGRDSS